MRVNGDSVSDIRNLKVSDLHSYIFYKCSISEANGTNVPVYLYVYPVPETFE